MRRVRTSELTPGMKTAEDVYSFNNQMIIPKDAILTDKMITRLEFYSILAIRVHDEMFDSAEEADSEPMGPPFSERFKETAEFKEFEQNFFKNTEDFKNDIHSIVDGKQPIDSGKLLSHVSELISTQSSDLSIFNMLHNMRQYDDMTYMHCMNVSLICNVFAKWLKLPQSDIDKLTLAGLLHDIGKVTIPDKIIKKPDKLSPSEYNIVKTHTLQGYNIVKGNPGLDDDVKECVLMHHERCDGTGYPLGLKSDKINKYAKIVAIADVYDAMTAARIYRGPLCPFKVISIFESEGLNKYDGKYILTFLEHVAITYMNNRVKLSNGMEGDVVFMNRNALSRPMIKCGKEFIDLSRTPDVYIETFV